MEVEAEGSLWVLGQQGYIMRHRDIPQKGKKCILFLKSSFINILKMSYNVFWSCPFPSPSPPNPAKFDFVVLVSFVFSFLKSLESNVYCPTTQNSGTCPQCSWPTRVIPLRKLTLFFPSSYQMPLAPQLVMTFQLLWVHICNCPQGVQKNKTKQ